MIHHSICHQALSLSQSGVVLDPFPTPTNDAVEACDLRLLELLRVRRDGTKRAVCEAEDDICRVDPKHIRTAAKESKLPKGTLSAQEAWSKRNPASKACRQRRKTQDTDVGNLAVALSDHDLLPEHRNAPYPIVPSMRSSPSTPLKETKASDLRNHHIKSRCNGGIRSCAPTSSDLLAAPNARCWQLTGSSFALCASSPPFRFHAGGSCMGHRRHRMQSFGVISVM